MIFYTKEKNLVVNSKKLNRPLRIIARFKDNEFETKDPKLIERLRPHFKNDGTDFESMNYMKLRKIARDKGMKVDFRKKVDLVAALERSERYE